MSAYKHGTVTVPVTAVLLCTVNMPSNGVVVQNKGAVDVYLGGPTVTADVTATGGIKVVAGTTITIPSFGVAAQDLYAIAVSSTSAVGWLSAL